MFRAPYRSIASVTSLGAIVAVLAACSSLEAPETGARVPASALAADYPDLLTAEQISRNTQSSTESAEDLLEEQEALAARLALLKARAAALNSAVLTPGDRTRLSE